MKDLNIIVLSKERRKPVDARFQKERDLHHLIQKERQKRSEAREYTTKRRVTVKSKAKPIFEANMIYVTPLFFAWIGLI